MLTIIPVSYTHLDVYKRQALLMALAVIVPVISRKSFVPDTSHTQLLLIAGIPVLCIVLIPTIAVYRHALAALKR